MHKFLWLNFIFSLDALQVSDYISPSSGATYYVWLLCGYTTQQPDVSEYTKCDVQLIKLLLMMDWYSPKHVEHLMENKV